MNQKLLGLDLLFASGVGVKVSCSFFASIFRLTWIIAALFMEKERREDLLRET
jgi:hypothetical protein